jgi:glycosyltransferase involved in cell wall biosynthesis
MNANASVAPMRVLQVIEASLAGTRRYLEDVFTVLGDGSHNGIVYSLHRADDGFRALVNRMRGAGWTLFEVDMRRHVDLRHDLANARTLQDVYRRFRPDVVHAHSSKAGAVARLATVGMPRRPGIVYTPNAIGVNLGWVYRPLEHVLALRLDVLSAVTESERDELHALRLVPRRRLHVVVPSIRSDVYRPADRGAARAALGLGAEPLVIGIGRLAAQKDPLAFVDVIAGLRERVGPLRAIWLGDGELREPMRERIAAARLDDVISLAGWVDDPRTHIAACDLFVSTSVYESFGYVTAEALAMERPVVASSITGTIDVVQTDMELQLYPYRDLAAAVDRAERLLRDPELATAVARRGRAHVLASFSAENTRLGLTEAYAAAVQR